MRIHVCTLTSFYPACCLILLIMISYLGKKVYFHCVCVCYGACVQLVYKYMYVSLVALRRDPSASVLICGDVLPLPQPLPRYGPHLGFGFSRTFPSLHSLQVIVLLQAHFHGLSRHHVGHILHLWYRWLVHGVDDLAGMRSPPRFVCLAQSIHWVQRGLRLKCLKRPGETDARILAHVARTSLTSSRHDI